jgi:hypothetical protein
LTLGRTKRTKGAREDKQVRRTRQNSNKDPQNEEEHGIFRAWEEPDWLARRKALGVVGSVVG